jgi:hypothetical protein
MRNIKYYLITFTMLATLIGFMIDQWEGPQSLSSEMAWFLKKLPELKSLEYLETMKKAKL